MNYDMNMIKHRKSGFFRIAAAILMSVLPYLGLPLAPVLLTAKIITMIMH
ncbi:MAG: hypothetical protein ACLRNW_06875 [Neglectibacter sp.]